MQRLRIWQHPPRSTLSQTCPCATRPPLQVTYNAAFFDAYDVLDCTVVQAGLLMKVGAGQEARRASNPRPATARPRPCSLLFGLGLAVAHWPHNTRQPNTYCCHEPAPSHLPLPCSTCCRCSARSGSRRSCSTCPPSHARQPSRCTAKTVGCLLCLWIAGGVLISRFPSMASGQQGWFARNHMPCPQPSPALQLLAACLPPIARVQA